MLISLRSRRSLWLNGQGENMESQEYDIAIVGGGIIGLSTAMHLMERFPRLRVAVVEKENELAAHQTGHNSGVFHSGIYYRPVPTKPRFCVAGVRKLLDFCDENEIEYEQCGKVIVATDESELGRLEGLYERGTANGGRRLGVGRTGAVGRNRAPRFRGQGIVVPANGNRRLPQSDRGLRLAVRRGRRGYLRRSGREEHRTLRRVPGPGDHEGDPAGPSLDKLRRIVCRPRGGGWSKRKVDVRIITFRGEYYTLRSESHHLVSGLIYPVPDPRFPFLGVHYTRNINGSVEAGPNAVLALSREGYRKRDVDIGETWSSVSYPGFWRMTLKHWKTGLGEMHRSYRKGVFLRDLQRLLPDIREADLAPGGSGVRAQAVARDGTLLDDFNIIRGREAVHVLNAPSPGATSSLAIGEYIVDLAGEAFGIDA